MSRQPIKTIIVGAGHRSLIYASLAKLKPDKMKIVGVVEPDKTRREAVAKSFDISLEHCFESVEQLENFPKFADAAINGTMDSLHVKTTVPLLKMGLDVLLEKPFAVTEQEARYLVKQAEKYNKKIMVCFVLRYSKFYSEIKKLLAANEIGDIINMQLSEFVSYHHMSTSHVRGKWNNQERCHASMLLAKCCHDLDIMMWLMGDDKPVAVSSFGSNKQFVLKNAPKNAGTRCLLDCPLVDECLYSAKRLYIDHPDRWSFYVWPELEEQGRDSIEEKIEHLKTKSHYGVCAYKSDNNVVDHQSVLVNFKSGATATHNMVGGAASGRRTVHIIGTTGEIFGCLEQGEITVSKIDPRPGCEHIDEIIDVRLDDDSHGGGDLLLAEDFVDYVSGEKPSIACTSVQDSLKGHLTVFLADESRENGGAVMPIVL